MAFIIHYGSCNQLYHTHAKINETHYGPFMIQYAVISLQKMITVIGLVMKALPLLPHVLLLYVTLQTRTNGYWDGKEMRRETADRDRPPSLAYFSLIVLLSRTDDVWVPDDVLYPLCLIFMSVHLVPFPSNYLYYTALRFIFSYLFQSQHWFKHRL